MENTEAIRARLLEKANSLPLSPGVYLMRDRNGKVIYVGKSRKLHNRVAQYFQNGDKNVKTGRMVAAVREFDYYLCANEMEALTLENTLIKQFTPKYNIRLKDAKSYPYLKITNEEYPRLLFTRRRENDRAKYFGPYSGSGTAYALIGVISRVLRLPTCRRSFPREIGRGRPCIYYEMGKCAGLCTGKVSAEEHRAAMKFAADILNGKNDQVRRSLEEQMLADAEAERFEAAAKCRDTIRALDAIREKQTVVASPDAEQDVFAVCSDDFCTCVSVFYIRGGVVHDTGEFLFGADGIPEDLTAFLLEHYQSREYVPPRVLLGFRMEEEDRQLLADALSALAGRRIDVHTPERGNLRTLCELVQKNAAERVKRYRMDSEKEEGTVARLAELLRLEVFPERIEAYDISNLGSEHLTAGMIVWKNGGFSKADYRNFRIRSVTGTTDDYASMREALERRLAHLSDASGSFGEEPDLILLDGGKGHVSVIRALLSEMGLEHIPVFGMVKDEFHKSRALCTDREEIGIAREREVYALIYRIQEEIHRYTVRCMEQAKRKTLTHSSLTAINGIGDSKAKKLLAAFGGLAGVKKATVGELAAVKGISARDAEAVYRNYHEKESKPT